MANEHLTSIHVVLDRSGSMSSVRADIIGGFNAFLAEQRAHPSDAWLTLAQFDDEYEIVLDHVSLGEAGRLGFSAGSVAQADLKSAVGARAAWSKLSKGMSAHRSKADKVTEKFFEDDEGDGGSQVH